MIHPSSVVSPEAKIGKDVVIGPFCRVFDNVEIGDGTILESHVVVGNRNGKVKIGKNNKLSSFSCVGGQPQDLGYKGQKTELVMGDGNLVGEYVTINCGTTKADGRTVIGNECMIMAYVHVAHDCVIADNVIIANSTQLAGHVVIENRAYIGGMCGINQFVRIGRNAFVTGNSMVNKDIVPFSTAQGNYAVIRAMNKVGLERAGFSDDSITNIKRAIRIVTQGSSGVDEAITRISTECTTSNEISEFVSFIKSSERGIAL